MSVSSPVTALAALAVECAAWGDDVAAINDYFDASCPTI